MERSHPKQGRIEFGAPPEQLLTARQESGKRKPVLPSFKLGKSMRFRSADVDAPCLKAGLRARSFVMSAEVGVQKP